MGFFRYLLQGPKIFNFLTTLLSEARYNGSYYARCLPAICPLIILPIKVQETRPNQVLMGTHSLNVIVNGPTTIFSKRTMV